ncbi:NUDIX hydrolase, partial [Verrucomicrobia bacterium]|nr:NUDIX hydrolase [Verrucomicrobiota bacterium]
MSDIQPWPIKSTREIGDFRIFKIRGDQKKSPRNGHEMEFTVLECVNWVNVVAKTTDGQIVMVEQFRHGSETVELEIPGGVMDAEDTDPIHTAVRELREETGYEGKNARIIGQVFSNPAIMNNTTYTVLIEDCEMKHELEL